MLTLAALVGGARAHAADTKETVYLGGSFGMASFSTGGASARFTAGLAGGTVIKSLFGVGLYYLSSGAGITSFLTSSAVTAQTTTLIYGVEGTYFMPSSLPGIRFGFKLGMAKTSEAITVDGAGLDEEVSSTALSFGPKMGYDHHVHQHVTLGGDFEIVFIRGAASATILNFLATVRFWF